MIGAKGIITYYTAPPQTYNISSSTMTSNEEELSSLPLPPDEERVAVDDEYLKELYQRIQKDIEEKRRHRARLEEEEKRSNGAKISLSGFLPFFLLFSGGEKEEKR